MKNTLSFHAAPPLQPSRPIGLARCAALARQLHDNEGGMISMVSIIVLMFIIVLIGLTANVGYTINRKVEVQNSADAVAYTNAIWLARGMNSITTANHLIGEMQALVIAHTAIGGEEMENKQPLDPQEAQQAKNNLDVATQELDIAHVLLASSLPETPPVAYPFPPGSHTKVGELVKTGATLRASMTDLKRALAKVYVTRAGASALKKFPLTAGIGAAVDGVAIGVEYVILTEYTALKFLENSARAAIPMRDALFNTLLPGAAEFEQFTVDNVPAFAAESGKAVARENDTTGGNYPLLPPLPVLRDNESGTITREEVSRSALVRAAYPWVIYDRTPMLKLMSWMIFSRARKHYLKYTDHYTPLKSKELYDRGFTMYVMTKRDESKGFEPWTNDSRQADRKFTVVGFAHRPGVTIASSAVFGVPNRDGIVACAQAILYNANSQRPASGPPAFQPEVGWDTLNWQPPVSGSGAFEFRQGPEEMEDAPRILVNWQAKLTPVTRLVEAAGSGEVGSPFSAVLSRVSAAGRRLLTH